MEARPEFCHKKLLINSTNWEKNVTEIFELINENGLWIIRINKELNNYVKSLI